MQLTAPEIVFLREMLDKPAKCVKRVWSAGEAKLDRPSIGRLWRCGYLAGRRGAKEALLSALGRKVAREHAGGVSAPPVGVELEARGRKSTLRGRVIESTSTQAILIPRDQPDGVPQVYRIHRPHMGAPWKGHSVAIGAYYGKPLWSCLEGLAPSGWSAPLTSKPYTVARLREVASRLDSVGAYPMTGEEGAAMSYGRVSTSLTFARRSLAHSRGGWADYLRATVDNDPAPFDAAELAYATEQVRSTILPWRYGWSGANEEPFEVRSFGEIAKRHKELNQETLRKAYDSVEPWARARVEVYRERSAKYEERREARRMA